MKDQSTDECLSWYDDHEAIPAKGGWFRNTLGVASTAIGVGLGLLALNLIKRVERNRR